MAFIYVSDGSNTQGWTPLQFVAAYTAWPAVMVASLLWTYHGVSAGYLGPAVSTVAFVATLLTCMGLERWIPYRPEWGGHALQHQTDALHMVLSEFITQIGVRFVSAILGYMLGAAASISVWSMVGLNRAPVVLQLAVVVVLFDALMYWLHRIQHERDVLWPIHSLHHSPRFMNTLTAVRNHPIHSLVSGLLAMLVGTLGVPGPIFFMMLTWLGVKGFLQHSNADLRTPGLDSIFQTPALHRWHHSTRRKESDANFGIYLTLWDRVPWHRLPVLGPHMRFQSCTYRPGQYAGCPRLVGLEQVYIDRHRSALGNWWSHMRYPLECWSRMLTRPLHRVLLSWLGWPIVVGGAVGGAWWLHTSGVPIGLTSAIIAVFSFSSAGLLQRVNPLRLELRGDVRSLKLDLAHIVLSMALGNKGVTFLLAPLAAWLGSHLDTALGQSVWTGLGLGAQPVLVQFALAAVFVEVFLYWQHRLMHEVPALWETHRIHHAIRTLGPLRALRHHPLSPILTALVWFFVGFLGMPPEVFLMCQGMHASCAALQHCNADLRMGWLDHIFASPTFHRWHHSASMADANRNFAPNLSLMDQIPWHRMPVLGRHLPFQFVTFRRGADIGPERIGLDAWLEDPNQGTLQNWWFQVSEPVRTWASWRAR